MQFKIFAALILMGAMLNMPSMHINTVAWIICMSLMLLASFGVDIVDEEVK